MSIKFPKIHTAFLLAAALALTTIPSAFASEVIGHVKSIEGSVEIVRAGVATTAQSGDGVMINDMLRTAPGGAMGVTFRDNTRISIGSDTEFVIDDFVYQPEREQLSFGSRITQGTLQFVSGTIAHLSPESVSINTPTGTIGVRGTRLLVRVQGH